MPDHYRNKANGFGSSLALVGEPPKTITGSSPGRSSGFSEVSEDRPNGEDLPLSLVVRRELGESSDSGQEEPDITIAKVNPSGGSPGEKSSIIKIKDFAKLLCEKESNSSSCSGSSVSGGHPCDFCDKVFINKYHLQSHVVTHTGERSFECRKCAKSFGRKSTLRAHMTTHTKVSNFMCPLCDKACNDNNSLEEHIRMHTGEKPFVCSICSKSYARKSHLNVHYRVHTGERPFVCLNCRKDFTEKRFLNDHIQTAHSGQDGPLKCPNCFREFAYKTSLKQHLKKQMCVKNLNRSGNSGGSGGNQNGCSSGGSGNNNGGGANTNFPPNVSNNTTPHSKQFSCPFCEKSYSWKQTLKQHVSMYHRNKVHTDEFWKYELTKHRRAVVDSKTNEDMWKKQLGKHGCEQNSSGELWLDQIQVIQPNQSSSQGSSPSKSSISAEMKLLALQSLQSSLKLMKMQEETPSVAAPTGNGGDQSGYLSLLAHISSAQRRVAVDSRPPSESSPSLPEEPAAKRTQMWLAQLGRYRQKSIHFEMEKNHEELWEEQIAKIKNNPVKSPLEPLEITLDDEEEDEAYREEQRSEMQETASPHHLIHLIKDEQQLREEPLPIHPVKMVPLMSALEVTGGESSFHPILSNTLAEQQQPTPPAAEDIIEDPEAQKMISSEGGSVLKSLLLDRFGRKRRPSLDLPSIKASPPPPVQSQQQQQQNEDCSDILRRRLLGLSEETEQVLVLDIDAENNNNCLSNNNNTISHNNNNNNSGSSDESIQGPIKSPKMEPPSTNEDSSSGLPPKKKESSGITKDFTRTSVLKHLLHRYTESHNME